MLKLAEGELFDPYRPRSMGVLTESELELCRNFGIPVGFDCTQIGWVAMSAEDDLAPAADQFSLLQSYKRKLGNLILPLLAANAAGEMSRVEARNEALARLAVIEGELRTTDCIDADRVQTVLKQEIVRFFPNPTSREEVPSISFCEFRPWLDSDIDSYRAIMGNPNVWEFMPEDPPSPMTEELAASLIEVANVGSHHKVRAVVADNTLCGQVRLLFNQDYPGLRSAEVTYLLGEEFWGKGLMTRVLTEFTRESLVEHSLDFICAWIRPDNVGSVKCAERAGYVRDPFDQEEELARCVDRDGFVRFKCYRADLGV